MLVWLIDFDGKMENLALMYLSAWHKARGDTVRLKRGNAYPELFERPDRVYISCIFRWNKTAAMRLFESYGDLAAIGGTGVDIQTELSQEIANTPPDYELYGQSRAIGFISRGCVRRCPWCVVPEKEGGIHRVATAQSIIDEHSPAVFLDNNFLALPDFHVDLEWLAENQVPADFNQGLDTRLVDAANARLLAACKWDLPGGEKVRLALDSDGQKAALGKAVQHLVAAGLHSRDVFVYCLIGFAGLESDLDRLFYLRSLGVRVFPMGYRDLETGKEPMHGWSEKLYRKYKRLIIRMPFANNVWEDFKMAVEK